jgi:nucleoside-diphosphate-sugar epimerase
MTKASILLTGGAGYIGSILTPQLLNEGFSVTVIDNLMYRQDSLLQCCENKNFTFVKSDVANEDLLKQLMPSHDIIIPLAAIVGAPACKMLPAISKLVNFDAVKIIIKHLKPHHKVLFPNTNSGYGIGQNEAFCTEESPLNPISLYGRQKVEIEKELLETKQAICFRLATVFGLSPRMRLDLLVNDFTFRACRDRFIILFEEHFKRNFIHVKDVAQAFLFGINHFEKMKGQAYNLGLSSANISKLELCLLIKKFIPDFYIHCASVGEDPDKRNYQVSNKKIEALGFKLRHDLNEGIEEIIRAYPILMHNNYNNL